MSNVVPEDWQLTTLEKNALLITDGSHFSPETVEYGKPIATVQNMSSRHIDIASCRLISDDKFNDLVKGNCQPILGDVLFSKDGTIGKTFVYKQNQPIVLLSSIAIIRLLKEQLYPDFCTQYLQSSLFYKQLEDAKSGSAIKRVVLKDIKQLELPLPPLPEQKKIAAILTSVDEVIEKTQAQIDKLKDLKTAMMQELLTCGVGVDGKPHTEFKDSPVGRIPKGWEVKSVQDISHCVIVGVVIKPTQYYTDSGVPALRSANVRETGLTLSNLKYFSSESNEILKKSKLQFGDLLTVRTGYPGTTAVVTSKFVGANCIDVVITRPFSEKVNSNFLSMWINSDNGKGQVLKAQGGLAQQHFNVGDMKNLLVALPPLAEQDAIFKIIQSVLLKIQAQENKLKSIQNTKKALMQDLLTGKVRVKVD